ncbi:MAG: toll/interleukin-1 receptor domain-containing protein [Acidobacteriota bacterium]|nr:toll/interleukin-1 receptor domain-containing protein [Acidobacteriota bacterium]
MGRAIFISYRRDDTEGEAGRLFDDLTRTFGEKSVFMDVTDIKPGLDFRKVIDDNVATCGVLLAVIGPAWATVANSSGERRLDDPNDFVRLEIASALARDIAVIPVLVHGASMPHPDQLPENLKDLAFRNSVEITHTRWNSDVQLLIDALRQYVGASSVASSEPVHATVSVQLPPANAPVHEPSAARASKTPLYAGIAVAALLAIAAATFFARHGSSAAGNSTNGTAGNTATPAATTTAASTESPLAGAWVDSSPLQRGSVSRLEIAATGNQLSIHAWGKCKPADCDWGTQAATFDGQKATATWAFLRQTAESEKGRVVTVTINPENAHLHVAALNTYPHRPATERQAEFVRAQ